MRELTADDVVRILGLEPHPEGGAYRETYRDPERAVAVEGDHPGGREREWSTAIYFFLREGELSQWHRMDASELWHHYAGAPLTLEVSPDGRSVQRHRLGVDLAAGERPQGVVPRGAWLRAWSEGSWTLVGCTTAPAFSFRGFELAPDGWEPGEG